MKHQLNLTDKLSKELNQKLNSFFDSAQGSKVTLPSVPEFAKELEKAFVFSEFIFKKCTKNPALLESLVKNGSLEKNYSAKQYNSNLTSELLQTNNEKDLSKKLRLFRTKEMGRIAWRDINGKADLFQTIAELSDYADVCINQTLAILYKWLCKKDGTPVGLSGKKQKLVIIGMGKLGGKELNFSSDVDLIFAYSEEGNIKDGYKTVTNDEFFTKLCRKLLNMLAATSYEGLVFRTDLRLRPYGETGPIVMSFDAMEEYYQNYGREWERYALIKARIVAGDQEAGKNLLKRLKPFIYRRYLDYSAIESLRYMKEKIDSEVTKKGYENNIKLGAGGIREIEFFGQIFQLIRGGVEPILQKREICGVLKGLKDKNCISTKSYDELISAYIFLRNVEHRLQEFSDQQIHTIPKSNLNKLRLAQSMQFSSINDFEFYLSYHKKNVHYHFNALLGNEKFHTNDVSILEKELKRLWGNLSDKSKNIQLICNAGFKKADKVIMLLNDLKNDPATMALSMEGQKRLEKLVPKILIEIANSKTPHSTLKRIFELIKTVQRRVCYLSLLLENPASLIHLIKLADASSWITCFLMHHPVLLDELIDPRTLLYSPPQKKELEKEIYQRISLIAPDDLEYQMDEMRIFKQGNVLRVAAADVTGVLPLMKVSDRLTEIAETILEEVLEFSWKHLVTKHGRPSCMINKGVCEKGFVVVAYGKLGGIELGYESDLDLVFLHAGEEGKTNGKQPIDNKTFFVRLCQRVIHFLSAHTMAGILYKTDMRLRPSGTSGFLVSHINAFYDYQKKDAWTWEHQALVRARPIAGEPKLAEKFERIRSNILIQERTKNELAKDVITIRQRLREEQLYKKKGILDLKQGYGGILDIEFLVQYLTLLYASKHIELVNWTDNIRLIETMAKTGIMDDYTATSLKEAYMTYRATIHRLSLKKKKAIVPNNHFLTLREKVIKACKFYLGASF